MATKTELTLMDRLEKHGAPKHVAARIDALLDGKDFLKMSITDLLHIPGMGRKNALLVMEVACDLAGKK